MHPPRTSRPCLAVVDDDEGFGAVVCTVAESLGWDVRNFLDGRSFCDALSASLAPDLIVLDVVMPEMDGIEVMRQLRSMCVRSPIVLVSGYLPMCSHTDRKIGRDCGPGVAALLQKPVRTCDLRAALDRPLAEAAEVGRPLGR